MNILVSGGTGYVGFRLIQKLLKEGHEVVTLSRKERNNYICPTVQYDGTVLSLKKCFEVFQPETVIHLATNMLKEVDSESIDQLLSSNLTLSAHLLQLSSESTVSHFINISTYSTSIDGQTYSPQTLYAATKKATEDLCDFYTLNGDFSVTTLCPYDIYGPDHPHSKFLSLCIESLRQGKEFHMSPGNQEICFVHVDDVVNGICHAMKSKKKREHKKYSLYGNEIFKLKELPSLIADLLELPLVKIEYTLPYREHEIMNFSPLHPLLENWEAQATLKSSISSLKSAGY